MDAEMELRKAAVDSISKRVGKLMLLKQQQAEDGSVIVTKCNQKKLTVHGFGQFLDDYCEIEKVNRQKTGWLGEFSEKTEDELLLMSIEDLTKWKQKLQTAKDVCKVFGIQLSALKKKMNKN